ncbi:hypothetical protein [Campylobacter curvus]|uniref:hypothetical protein n=1 Tax=Campylobacter curvus TaxID=200 RepID=UPI0014703114|nr:hypothetical protein [Campylobacter curvus]
MINKILNFTTAIVAAFILLGCVKNEPPQRSQTFQVTIFSPLIKINDVGFLHSYKNGLNLQIYSSGVNTADIKIDDEICVNRACFSKTEFNEKFFLRPHYETIFQDVLQKKEIYDGKNLVRKACGFEQNISNDSIEYEVCDNLIKFIDTKNRIRIILKELK